jgi:NAD(P)-dependent dehydrogenase (short-subunit alcohol dehydrogenase family)
MREIFSPDLFAGRRVLITGGGTGIGKNIARRLLQLKAEVAICGRRAPVLDEAAAELRSEIAGAAISAHVCDIRDAEAVDRMMQDLWAERPLDALVNNAAANFIAQTDKLSARAADAILAVTLHGAMYCTLAAGRRWIEAQAPGVVLSILSTSTITGRPFTAPSAMAKSGVLAMTRSLAMEWGPRGIRLVAIAPGHFPTPGASAQLNPTNRHTAATAAFDIPNPLGRVGEHVELANLAAYLLSDAAGYINGEMVTIDGGYHLRTSGAEDLLRWTDAQWDEHRASLSKGK